MEQNEIVIRIKTFFLERGHDIEEHTDLFESGALDSMGVLELVAFLEDQIGFDFDATQMVGSNFQSVNAIMKLIKS
ncbi:acyl carrier protein [Chlorobium phaeovibrioides]|uniref:acyl carrier protein n=1 Tax=Chlorobium phaeovibrioides TaxID=1094 RepID=UPI000F839295|nr:acyl carrier protein [Chlorobium phaeovibrioides]RTY33465.1 acyl carrier protein [Chlorobium phaeovibrioides]